MQPLDVLCSSDSFWIAQNPSAPLDLSRLAGTKRQTLEWLLQQRFELSPQLQERISLHLRHRGSYGMLVQFVVGCLCPCPGVDQTAAWDYDRDMDVLRQEVAAVLAQHLAPGSWELQERIDSQASFRDGKRLLALYLT
ncbi:hypothetical protein COHA_002990 [Chlorella ohadii]|uniref:Uncharacterized protein n=1 Tax=Chlorella ohadii TaxID=2649997 RepID=A0AAD5DSB1_9CHLO|nr:hypothetical protein COHA_002990 [Chlorella ohadii]